MQDFWLRIELNYSIIRYGIKWGWLYVLMEWKGTKIRSILAIYFIVQTESTVNKFEMILSSTICTVIIYYYITWILIGADLIRLLSLVAALPYQNVISNVIGRQNEDRQRDWLVTSRRDVTRCLIGRDKDKTDVVVGWDRNCYVVIALSCIDNGTIRIMILSLSRWQNKDFQDDKINVSRYKIPHTLY